MARVGVYLSSELLTARVGGEANYLTLTNDGAPPYTTADENIETLLLANVDRLAESYVIRGGYTIPLAVTDSDFLMWALLDISNYKARTRGARKASDDDLLQYQAAMAFLELVATGAVKLPSSGGSNVEGGTVAFDSQTQIMNRRKLRTFF